MAAAVLFEQVSEPGFINARAKREHLRKVSNEQIAELIADLDLTLFDIFFVATELTQADDGGFAEFYSVELMDIGPGRQ